MKSLIRIVFILFIASGIILISCDVISSYEKIKEEQEKVEKFLKGGDSIQDKDKDTDTVFTEADYEGLLVIPKINLKQTFKAGDVNDNSINKSITALKPIVIPSTEGSYLVMAAHSGNTNYSFFKRLHKLRKGDVAYIYFKDTKYKYRVVKYYVEKKDGDITIRDNTNNIKLVLTTCKSSKKQLVYIAYLESKHKYIK